jgi:hypothetical protein
MTDYLRMARVAAWRALYVDEPTRCVLLDCGARYLEQASADEAADDEVEMLLGQVFT